VAGLSGADAQRLFPLLRAGVAAVYIGGAVRVDGRKLAASADAEAGEVLSTAVRITPGDFASWTAQWLATARRVHHVADECRERGHAVSAREAYLRAANYYRAAEFYLHGDPTDPRIRQFSRDARSCFRAALALGRGDVRALAIPYEGTTLPG
jgi:hypothetical protein